MVLSNDYLLVKRRTFTYPFNYLRSTLWSNCWSLCRRGGGGYRINELSINHLYYGMILGLEVQQIPTDAETGKGSALWCFR